MRPVVFGLALGLVFLAAGCAAPTDPASPATGARSGVGPWGAPGSAARGAVLAETRCAGCHATGPLGESPMPAAPPFRGLAQRYPVADLQEALAEGLVTAHPAMPEITLEEKDISDLIAWLDAMDGAEVRQRR